MVVPCGVSLCVCVYLIYMWVSADCTELRDRDGREKTIYSDIYSFFFKINYQIIW